MAGPFTRASLGRGPAFVTFNGATLYLRGDIDTKHAPAFNPVKSSLTGQIDKTKKDLVIKNNLLLFGLYQDLTVLFPSWLMNPVPGTSVFGSTDLPMVIQARNNDTISYANTQITKLLGLHLGVDNELFAAAVEMTSILANGGNPEDAAGYFTRGTTTYVAPASLALTNYVKTRWTAAWTGKTGLTSFVGQKGFDVTWNSDLKPVEVEGWGTVDMTVGEGAMVAQCKCVPIVPTGAQIDTAQAVSVAHGGLLSANAADLTLTTGARSIVLKTAALIESSTMFGVEPLRTGEAVWETTRAVTAGAMGAVATVA